MREHLLPKSIKQRSFNSVNNKVSRSEIRVNLRLAAQKATGPCRPSGPGDQAEAASRAFATRCKSFKNRAVSSFRVLESGARRMDEGWTVAAATGA